MDSGVITVNNPLRIACTADIGYGQHVSAMIHSALAAHAPGSVHVHFLHGPDLRPVLRHRLMRLARRLHGHLYFHEIPDTWVAGLPVVPRIPALMWYRIFLPRLLPDADRVLYLDADTLVLEPLDGLWNMDLTHAWLGAVTNVMAPEHADWPRQIGVSRVEDYFNSGVLLLNLDTMRRDDCTEQIRRKGIALASRPLFPDQDALNAVLSARRKHLHPRWNCMNSLAYYLPRSRDLFEPGTVDEALRTPGIVHFEGPATVKPWHFLNRNRHRDAYYAHVRASGWPARLPEGITLRSIAKRYLPLETRRSLRRALRWITSPRSTP